MSGAGRGCCYRRAMPEPILVSIAAALAGKAAVGLYELATRKFARDPKATAEIEAAVEAPEDPRRIEVLAARLERAERADPDFRAALRAEWASYGGGAVVNQVRGRVGKVIQARDIHGDITL